MGFVDSCFLGNIYGLAGEYAWLMETLAAMAKVLGWPDDAVKRLNAMTSQLLHGVTDEGIELVALRTRGFARGRIMGLVSQGITTIEGVLKLAGEKLGKLLTENVAQRVCQVGRRLLQIREIEESRPETDGAESDAPANDAAESVEWKDQFPPSDDMGFAYNSDVPVVIDGQPSKRRNLVRINGVEVSLTDKSFEAFITLALQAKHDELGWVNSGEIDHFTTYHQTIRRLRGQIDEATVGVASDKLIENDTCKRYRLSVPPHRIQIDRDTILRHSPSLTKIFQKYDNPS